MKSWKHNAPASPVTDPSYGRARSWVSGIPYTPPFPSLPPPTHASRLLPPTRSSPKAKPQTLQLQRGGEGLGGGGAGGGGRRKGRERSEIRSAGARQNARNAPLPLINARHDFMASESREQKPPYQDVSLHLGRLDQALFLHSAASFLPIRHRARRTGAVCFWSAAVRGAEPPLAASQPCRQPSGWAYTPAETID